MKRILTPHVGIAALASPMEVGAGRAEQTVADLAYLLESAGCRVVNGGAVKNAEQARKAGLVFAEKHVSSVALSPASWFEDYLVLDLLEECNVPVLLWALPGMETGALCGTQQVGCYLRQLGKPYQAVFGEIIAGEQLDRCLNFLRASALACLLRRAKIGMAGQHVRGMTETAVNEIALKKTFGCRVVPLDMVSLLHAARKAAMSQKKRIWKKIKAAVKCSKVTDEAGREAAGMYLAIKQIIAADELSALAFGCYPDYMGCACLAASLLADEGYPVSCEGDVNGAVGMLILQSLTGQPTHNTDWLDPLPDGSVVFTHCGSSSYMLAENKEDITLAKVRLANQGVCSLFPAKSGPVTLVNIMPAGAGYQMAVLEGEALATEMVFPGNPLRVKFDVVAGVADPGSASSRPTTGFHCQRSDLKPVSKVLDWIFANGIGHHWMAGYGHVGNEIKDLANIIGGDLKLLAGN
jgi:L-fucose isomerase-like protein